MQKIILILFLTLLVFGITLNAPILMADDDNSGSDTTGVPSVIDDDDDGDNEDEERDEIRERTREKIERDRERFRMKEEIKKEFRDEDGNLVKIERKVEIKDGRIKIKIKRTVISSDGSVIEKTIVIERDADGLKRKIKIEGFDEFGFETELEIEDEFEGNETDIAAVLSNGRKALIKIMPDAASDIALQRLKALNFTKIELKEVRHGNEIRAAYKVEVDKEGRFFGIFKLKLKMNSLVDSETGEVLDTTKPWWAFLVLGEDTDQIVVVEEEQGAFEPVN